MTDRDRLMLGTCEALEQQAPVWEPGTQHGYHATTFGWLVGEVVRRVSGKSVGAFVRDELAGPLGLDLTRRKFGLVPRIENSDLTKANPPTIQRWHRWLACRLVRSDSPKRICNYRGQRNTVFGSG